MIDTNVYLNLVLVPVAELFRSRFPTGSAPFMAISNSRECRIKFTSRRLEREWQQFCKDNELQNHSTL